MLSPRHFLKGDTLIEVTIAVGIFALVAISVVAVVSMSTSGAQSSLETTLAREEVDAQAEALYFIQNAFYEDNKSNLNDGSDTSTKESLYRAIWKEIVSGLENNENINMVGNQAVGIKNDIDSFEPSTCSALYEDGTLENQKAFVLDLKKLNEYTDGYNTMGPGGFAKNVVIKYNTGNNAKLFQQADTYPQLEYDQDGNLTAIKGIYIVGVRDINQTTSVQQVDGSEDPVIGTVPAYYDFYVRSCWYNSGSEIPATVSTSVRLRNPAAIAYVPSKPTEAPDTKPDVDFFKIDWIRYGDRKYSNASGTPYCGEDGPTLSQSTSGSYYTTNCEPLDNQHIFFPDNTSIRMTGSTRDPVNLGVYYDKFDMNKPFSLEVDVDATNIGSHPSEDGGLTISFDIVDANGANVINGASAHITQSNQTLTVLNKESLNFESKQYKLLLEYDRGNFKACVTVPATNEQCLSGKADISKGAYLKVDYNLTHTFHACDKMAVVNLYNIKMRHSTHGTITF